MLGRTVPSVSYTHLDVYKRQVKDFIALYAPEDEEKLVLIQDGVSADKTFLDTYWAAHTLSLIHI